MYLRYIKEINSAESKLPIFFLIFSFKTQFTKEEEMANSAVYSTELPKFCKKFCLLLNLLRSGLISQSFSIGGYLYVFLLFCNRDMLILMRKYCHVFRWNNEEQNLAQDFGDILPFPVSRHIIQILPFATFAWTYEYTVCCR